MDARKLSPQAQEDLRQRVVYSMRVDGLGPVAAARLHGVSRQSATKWNRAVEASGADALKSAKRGPKPRPRLSAKHERAIRRAICGGCPDQLLLPFALWSREAVVALIEKETGRRVSVWTAGRYLRRWGFTPQKPMRRAYERNDAAVRAWLQEQYPAIKAQAKRERARIYWGDEMGLRSDDAVGRSYAPRGRTPVVKASGRRFGCSVISAVSNQGQLRFMVFKGRFVAATFISFLGRLLRSEAEGKLFLIVDSHPVHKARKVRDWIEADPTRRQRLRLFYLPGYSPELNPDECVNQDTKQALRKKRPRDQAELMSEARSHLQRRQNQPEVVKQFFQEEHVRYAA